MRSGQHAARRRRRPSRAVFIRRRIAVGGALVLVVLVIVLVATSGSGGGRQAPAAATRHTARPRTLVTVGLRTLSFLDKTRSTYNYVTGATTPGRLLRVEVRFPIRPSPPSAARSAPPLRRRGGYPLVVFAPGYRLRPEDYDVLLDYWVHEGFVVAAVEFPDTTYPASEPPYDANPPLPHGSPEADLYEEPGDVDFVLGQLALAGRGRSGPLGGLLAPGETVLAGHSDGGTAVAALLYDATEPLSVPRVRAAAVLSGSELPISNQTYGQPGTPIPLLVVQSALDSCNAPWHAVQLYNAVGAPKDFLLLDQASHLGAYDGADGDATAVVERSTTAFFESALGDAPPGSPSLAAVANLNGVSSLTDAAVANDIPTPPGQTSCPSD